MSNICETCNKSFGCNRNLQNHIKCVHLKLKPFKCDVCNQSFGENGHLQTHIRTVHMKEKNFKCETCNTSFGKNSNLQTHIKTVHMKLKPFTCQICDYSCSRNGYLQRHIKICTGKENISSGEYQVRETLKNMKVDFIYDATHDELTIFSGKSLRFDFLIEKEGFNNIVIEFNGKQHYEPVRFGGISQEDADRNFKKQKKRDRLKRRFCEENNYKILEIHYKDYGRINEIVSNYLIQHLDWGFEI